MCLVDGCENEIHCRGYCKKHYAKWWKYGDPLAGKERNKQRFCCVEGCGNPYLASGYCKKHYQKFKKYGDPLAGTECNRSGETAPCIVENCTRDSVSMGLCKNHYNRMYFRTEKGRALKKSENQFRRAKRRGAEAEVFSSSEVFEACDWKCGICGEPVDPNIKWPDPLSASLDHIVPLAKGGTHTRINTQLSHLTCNIKKNDKILTATSIENEPKHSARTYRFTLPFLWLQLIAVTTRFGRI